VLVLAGQVYIVLALVSPIRACPSFLYVSAISYSYEIKNEKLVVANFALVTVLSDGTPISKVSPNAIPQNAVLAAGAVVNVIVPALVVYAALGS